jgi:hypothetical protein
MALVSTQLLTEMSTKNLPGAKGRPRRKAFYRDSLTFYPGPKAASAPWEKNP